MDKPKPIFLEGAMFRKPREGAPDYVKGSLSFKVFEFKKFLDDHNNDGWVNADLKLSAKGALYLQLNTYKKENPYKKEEAPALTEEEKQAIKAMREREQTSKQVTSENDFGF